jgi:hypothetical protein
MAHLHITRCFTVLLLVVFHSLSASASAQSLTGTQPVLTSATNLVIPGTLVVRGANFTSGGEVYIVVHDRWGESSGERRWVTASEPAYGLHGSIDPANGARPGGIVHETFASLCDRELMVRAYDQSAGVWTGTMDVDLDCAGATMQAPPTGERPWDDIGPTP